MSSIINNPTQLIKCVPFLPKLKFPVYKFSVHNTASPVRNTAVHFRDLNSLCPPENATNNDYVNEYHFVVFLNRIHQIQSVAIFSI